MKSRILKVFGLIIAIAAIISVVLLTAFADGSGSQPMEISVSSAAAFPTETAEITIDLSNHPGITSLKFDVQYDDYLTLTDVKFSSAFGAYVAAPTPYKNPQRVTFISPLADVAENGNFVTLTFSVAEDAPDNYFAEVNLSCYQNEIYDADFDLVPVSVSNGGVNVIHGIAGDINSDRLVDTRDAILLFRYISGWDVEVDETAVDVTCDGIVDTRDAIILFRYVAGWDVEIGRGSVVHTHTLANTAAKAASCTEDGNIEYWQCTSCNKYFSDADGVNEIALADTIITSPGHNTVVDQGYAATCTANGLTDGSHCDSCGETIAIQEVIPAPGHNVVDGACTNCTYKVTHTVVFIVDGSVYRTETVNHGETIDLPRGPFYQTGYDFVGWVLDGGDQSWYNEKITVLSDLTFEALYWPSWYNFDFVVDGEIYASEFVRYLDTVTIPDAPSKSGYTFVGWFYADGSPFEFVERDGYVYPVIYDNCTLYAVFTKNAGGVPGLGWEFGAGELPTVPIGKT